MVYCLVLLKNRQNLNSILEEILSQIFLHSLNTFLQRTVNLLEIIPYSSKVQSKISISRPPWGPQQGPIKLTQRQNVLKPSQTVNIFIFFQKRHQTFKQGGSLLINCYRIYEIRGVDHILHQTLVYHSPLILCQYKMKESHQMGSNFFLL